MEQAKRVCHVLSSLKIGGAERFVIDLSKEQILHGYEVEILSFGNSSDELVEIAQDNKIKTHFVNKRWFSNNKHTYNLLKRFDVVHIHSPVSLKAILLISPLLRNVKIIYTRHGEGRYDSLQWKLVHKTVKPFINAVTFVSHNGESVFREVHPWPSKPHQVIENGIPLHETEKKSYRSSILKLGSVGRVVPIKKQEHLLQAWAALDEQIRNQIEIHIIGDGDQLTYLKELASQYKPSENIMFHGFMNQREEIQALFDVLVVTSESEGLSIAILEAMADHKAVIASDVGGNARLVLNNSTGLLYQYADIDRLKEHIKAYFTSRKLLEDHSQKAFEHVSQNFSINTAMKKYEYLYNA